MTVSLLQSPQARRRLLLAGTVSGLLAAPPAILLSTVAHAVSTDDQDQTQVWYPLVNDSLPPIPTPHVAPGKGRVLLLDHRRLRGLLAQAPLEGTGAARRASVLLELPWPDGSFKRFRIEKSPPIKPRLPAELADMDFYRGEAVEPSRATVRIALSSIGLQATVRAPEGQILVDPYPPGGDRQRHLIYFERDRIAVASDSCPCAMTGSDLATLGRSHPPLASVGSRGLSAKAGPKTDRRIALIDEVSIARMNSGAQCDYKLVLRRDGTAVRVVFRAPADGSAHRICRGSVAPTAFAALATLIHRKDFFDLNGAYSDPDVADGGVVVTTAVVNGRPKQVHNAHAKGPSNLKVVEDAIEALGGIVAWTELWPLR